MRHRDFLLRQLDILWHDYDTRRGMSHSNEEYAHYALRQQWIDEIREDIHELTGVGPSDPQRRLDAKERAGQDVTTERRLLDRYCDRASNCTHQHIVASNPADRVTRIALEAGLDD